VLLPAKGDGQDEQQSTKKKTMKTNTTIKTERRAQEQSEQVFKAQQPEVAKYIVLRWQGREQVTVFPFKAKHADVLAYIRGDSPDVQAVSAGFYLNEPDAFWSGGESDTLNLKSRPEDRQLLREFFESENRRQWDLNIVAQEAEASAALAGAN
jgi:hypothetical protein